jgi:hypothetical protein
MKVSYLRMGLVAIFLLPNFQLFPADKTVETEKPGYFGRQKSVVKDEHGRKIGEVVTEEPDYFGRKKSVIKDEGGRVIGTAETSKPDYFGKEKD